MVGKPDARRGELPVAYIQIGAGATVDLEALMGFCVQRAPERAGLPVEIILLDHMPLTPVGKISKPALKVDILRRTVEALAQARAGGRVQNHGGHDGTAPEGRGAVCNREPRKRRPGAIARRVGDV